MQNADAERLLAEFAPTTDEAEFIRQQAEGIFTTIRLEFLARTRNGSVQLRPMAVEMAIAYASFAAAEWTREAERVRG